MTTTQVISRVLLAALSFLFLIQCKGGANKADGAEITITPNTPIVITADIASPSRASPWFSFETSIENKTDSAFEIVALEAEITGTDDTGNLVSRKVAWSPSEFNYSTLSLQCSYASFGTWQPGDKKELQITGAGTCVSGIPQFIADGNPDGPNDDSFRYKVKLKPLGYFIDAEGDPSDRFEKFKLFFTK
jgi:hypothetical protein